MPMCPNWDGKPETIAAEFIVAWKPGGELLDAIWGVSGIP